GEGGLFQFVHLPAGAARLDATKPGYRQSGQGLELDIQPNADAFQQIVMQKIKTARVSIVGADGQPAANERVFCASSPADVLWQSVGLTDAGGMIEINTDQPPPITCAIPDRSAGLGVFVL